MHYQSLHVFNMCRDLKKVKLLNPVNILSKIFFQHPTSSCTFSLYLVGDRVVQKVLDKLSVPGRPTDLD